MAIIETPLRGMNTLAGPVAAFSFWAMIVPSAAWWRDRALLVLVLMGAAKLLERGLRYMGRRSTAQPSAPSPVPATTHRIPVHPVTQAERSVRQTEQVGQAFIDKARDRLD